MTIAFHTINLSEEQYNTGKWFAVQIANEWLHTFPGDHIIIITDSQENETHVDARIRFHRIRSKKRNGIFFHLWVRYTLPSILKKIGADIIIGCNGYTTGLPDEEIMIVPSTDWLQYPQFYNKRTAGFQHKQLLRSLKQCKHVVVFNHKMRANLKHFQDSIDDRIRIIQPGTAEYTDRADPAEKQNTQQQFAEGCAYLLYAGPVYPSSNLLNLLRAFSIFKKRMQTSMKLILAGELGPTFHSFVKDLSTYKYRNDVVLLGELPGRQLSDLIAASFAVIHPASNDHYSAGVFEAMRYKVPVLLAAGSAMQESAGDGALLFDAHDHQSIAEQLMRLYKDESMQQQLVSRAQLHVPPPGANLPMQQLRDLILQLKPGS